jgi:hypothetical protein
VRQPNRQSSADRGFDHHAAVELSLPLLSEPAAVTGEVKSAWIPMCRNETYWHLAYGLGQIGLVHLFPNRQRLRLLLGRR